MELENILSEVVQTEKIGTACSLSLQVLASKSYVHVQLWAVRAYRGQEGRKGALERGKEAVREKVGRWYSIWVLGGRPEQERGSKETAERVNQN